jgi:peptidyl-prolyl cis-trans isomerase D
MTMLDRMRRHKAWLKWSLGIVVVTFVLLYVPAFLRGTGGDGSSLADSIAAIDGHSVLVGDYRRAYQQQVDAMRANAGSDVDENMLKQLGVPQRVVQQLLDQQAILAQADRLGLRVSDSELRARILKMPGFQENGQFIGEARYRQLLEMQRPPLSESEFEDEMRTTLLAEKLQAAVTGWMRVTDADADQAYRKANEKVKLDLALFTATQYRAGIQPTDADLTAQFSAHTDTYKMPEKRRVRYLAVDAESLKAKEPVTADEVQQRYQANLPTYSTPEQVRAGHILFKTDGKNDEAQKKKAEGVLVKVKAGGDFAALAKQYSEDEGSKAKGGDLDYFGKGTMYKEFEDAAWALAPGQISGVVKSPAGFHIIKMVDRKAATTRTLADVTPQIQDQIRTEKAQVEAQKLADDISKDISAPADLDKVARARGLTVGDSGLFSRDEPLAGLGFAPAVAASAFTLDQGKVSGLLRTNTGFAFIALVEIKPAYVPQLSEVKDKVREDVIRLKALDIAKAKAASMSKAGGDFSAAAKTAGGDVKPTDFITRDSAYPEIGVNTSVDAVAFNLRVGETSAPIPTDTAIVVVHVKEKQTIDEAKMLAERDTMRDQLLSQRRQEFFSAYMAKARQTMKVTVNEAAIKAVLGGG